MILTKNPAEPVVRMTMNLPTPRTFPAI